METVRAITLTYTPYVYIFYIYGRASEHRDGPLREVGGHLADKVFCRGAVGGLPVLGLSRQ